jgi:hypothetical protein
MQEPMLSVVQPSARPRRLRGKPTLTAAKPILGSWRARRVVGIVSMANHGAGYSVPR